MTWHPAVDLDLCQAHQLCQSEAPGVFGFDRGSDRVVLLDEHPPDDLREDVRRAVVYCPAMALSLVEED